MNENSEIGIVMRRSVLHRCSWTLVAAMIIVLLVGVAAGSRQALSQSCEDPGVSTEHILIRMQAGTSDEALNLMKKINGEGAEEEIVPDLWKVDLPTGLTVSEAVERYQTSPEVEYAEPDGQLALEPGCQETGAGLEIRLSDRPDPVFVGGKLIYKAVVRNHGPDIATNVRILSGAPENSELMFSRFAAGDSSAKCAPGEALLIRCSIGDLGVDESAIFTMKVRPTQAGTLSGFASAQADNALPGLEASASTTTKVLPAPRTRAGACTITGTPGRDRLVGTPGRDIICGLGGPDRLVGKDGNDAIFGGRGRDVLVGGEGRDVLFSNQGRDILRARDGVRGNDLARGGRGRDRIFVDLGDDVRTKVKRAPTANPCPRGSNCY